ncbi:hypothetical protein L1987_10347 [Smallanthus sonchifolius]|uniref:Uncharacterized protein n=1 Tax=Smallanthus sonchifolius TaxID=185202 RepID=A0ACB9JRU4_9ASTR|nr:hypothetical protein L1987_10347 [Smallanthus sonchifolius]
MLEVCICNMVKPLVFFVAHSCAFEVLEIWNCAFVDFSDEGLLIKLSAERAITPPHITGSQQNNPTAGNDAMSSRDDATVVKDSKQEFMTKSLPHLNLLLKNLGLNTHFLLTIKKFKDALAKHKPDRCSLGPPKGLEEKELVALGANRDLSFVYNPKPEHQEKEVTPPPLPAVAASSSGSPSLPLPLPLKSTLESKQDNQDKTSNLSVKLIMTRKRESREINPERKNNDPTISSISISKPLLLSHVYKNYTISNHKDLIPIAPVHGFD